MDSWRKLCRARRVDRPAGCNRLGALPAADIVSRNAVFRVRLGCLQVCVAPSLTGTCLLVPHVHSVGDTLCSRLEDMATGGGEMCELAGFAPSEARDGGCFDGQEPTPRRNRNSSAKGKKGKKGGKSRGGRGSGWKQRVIDTAEVWKENFALVFGVTFVLSVLLQYPAVWRVVTGWGFRAPSLPGSLDGGRQADRRKLRTAALARARAAARDAYGDQ